jgi:hypothetical protein
MAQEHRSEHERLLNMEQKVSELQRSVGQLNTTLNRLGTMIATSGLDLLTQLKGYPEQAALFEQTLALLRSNSSNPIMMPPPDPPPMMPLQIPHRCLKNLL